MHIKNPAADELVNKYNNDLEPSLGNEFIQFSSAINLYKNNYKEGTFLLQTFHFKATYLNVKIALRIYLVFMVVNCSEERSFSKMKIIKNRVRIIMM